MLRARQCLTGAALAPGTQETLHELQHRRPQVQQRAVPEEILELDRSKVLANLRSAPRGSSPGPGTYEHLKILLDDKDTTELLMSACERLAQGKIPVDIRNALMGARLTALAKPLGGVRGIATGSTIRRLVARTLAKQFMEDEAECAPFQYALSTRAGTDPRVTVLIVDGIGAYDHVLRSAVLGRLCVSCVLPRARRGHVGHCQNPVGWSPRSNEAESQQLSTLPMRMGRLGLRSAARCAPAVCWASWEDALHMINQRTPDVAHDVLQVWRKMFGRVARCIKGFWWGPSRPELHEGKRPPKTEIRESGEWRHGWQCGTPPSRRTRC